MIPFYVVPAPVLNFGTGVNVTPVNQPTLQAYSRAGTGGAVYRGRRARLAGQYRFVGRLGLLAHDDASAGGRPLPPEYRLRNI